VAPLGRSVRLARQAEAAILAAVEIYNKHSFAYREETFAILALNAWELLLKLLAENANRPTALWVYEARTTKTGKKSRKQYLKRNRAGNPHTLGLGQVIVALEAKATKVPQPVRVNLDALIEIRDNAVHFINASPQLAKQVLEIGTAAVKNFVELGGSWFGLDLAGAQIYLMPIGFVAVPGTGTVVPLASDERNLLSFLTTLISTQVTDDAASCHAALEISLSFKRAPTPSAFPVVVTNDPNAAKVTLSEEDIRTRYPWSYDEVRRRLKRRYVDFKENAKFHSIRKPLMADPAYVKSRFLDPGNPRSAKKDFYSSHVLDAFDLHYTRKS
jgi:Domain of unknown function (DUF3644)